MKDEKSPEDIDEILAPVDMSDMKLDTLSGDVRDVMLQNIQQMKRPWSMLTEEEQYDVANSLELAAKDLVRNAVRMLTEFKYPRAVVTLSKINIIGGDNSRIDGTITAANLQLNRDVLGEHVGQHVALLAIDSTQFMDERAPVQIDKDQTEMDVDPDAAEPDEDAENADDQASEGDDQPEPEATDPANAEEFSALVKKAETLIRQSETATGTYLMKRLAITRSTADSIMNNLVRLGVVTEKDPTGKRSILPPKGKGDAPEGEGA